MILTLHQRDDEAFVEKHGKRKAFHLGSNSSCRQHIRGHYDVYKERCAEQEVEEHHHSVPREILKERVKKEKQASEGQQTLDGVFRRTKYQEFSREEVLKAVAEFVVCDDQVSIQVGTI